MCGTSQKRISTNTYEPWYCIWSLLWAIQLVSGANYWWCWRVRSRTFWACPHHRLENEHKLVALSLWRRNLTFSLLQSMFELIQIMKIPKCIIVSTALFHLERSTWCCSNTMGTWWKIQHLLKSWLYSNIWLSIWNYSHVWQIIWKKITTEVFNWLALIFRFISEIHVCIRVILWGLL